jgi:Carboxypeptidase regulatory-like domain
MMLTRSACFLAALALGAALAAGARAGSDSEPHEHHPDDGPSYFGFVKDASGVPVRDAKVSASYKNSLTLVTRTNATGAYRVNGFKNDVSPSDVTISCSKEGYKQARVFRYPLPKGKPVKSVETECRLQRQ